MRWQGRRGSDNIEDRRASAVPGGRLGIGGVLIVLAVGLIFGFDVTPLLQETGIGVEETAPAQITPADQRAAEFVSVTLADTEEVWREIFATDLGLTYQPPVLVLFKGVTSSPCGGASGATGPFYCPLDRKAYLDTDFFTTLERRMGAGGDFAAAYVVAHEIAHHVQNELGILGQANQVRRQVGQADSNAISVRIELQADCLSGVWARHAEARFGSLEEGDIAEALNAAARIGDDTLQRQAGQPVRPHTFTHGTSDQRQRWFAAGYRSGDVAACDTFGARDL
ncbi:KPN_02809 family neutral zinc metallopeptidase [Palleronia sp. KMU-117]|uniref:KPN_02809 family neutral zinc metallopeptidase n=1 Tax=Palleronia sp. KMU-117 TaxID=3434108 RepID=UPI003D71FB94